LGITQEGAEEDRRIENAVASAKDRLSVAQNVQSESKAWAEVVPVLLHERARLAIDSCIHRLATKGLAGNLAGGIKIDVTVMSLVGLLLPIPA
jgi:hypothetical protein